MYLSNLGRRQSNFFVDNDRFQLIEESEEIFEILDLCGIVIGEIPFYLFMRKVDTEIVELWGTDELHGMAVRLV